MVESSRGLLESINNIVINEAKPLRSVDINPDLLKSQLESAGFNMELTPQHTESLKSSKFRNYEEDRGIAMAHVLGEKQDDFETFIKNLCSGYRFYIGNDRARGARQFMADFISVAVGAMSQEDFCTKTNRRVLKARYNEARYPVKLSSTDLSQERIQEIEHNPDNKNFLGLGELTAMPLFAFGKILEFASTGKVPE